jgi:hypothetical protein
MQKRSSGKMDKPTVHHNLLRAWRVPSGTAATTIGEYAKFLVRVMDNET